MNFLDGRLPLLFWNKLQPCPTTGCWLWIGSTNAKGYGTHGRRAKHSRSQLTHRFTYECAIGALPAGTEIDHRCRTRCCANPAHMEAVPHVVNVHRGAAKKSICKRGHELAGSNLVATSIGMRCRACANAHNREYKRALYVPRKRVLKATCKHGHTKHHNGKRMVCPTCAVIADRASKQRRREKSNPKPGVGYTPR